MSNAIEIHRPTPQTASYILQYFDDHPGIKCCVVRINQNQYMVYHKDDIRQLRGIANDGNYGTAIHS